MQQPHKALNFLENLMNEPIPRKMKIPSNANLDIPDVPFFDFDTNDTMEPLECIFDADIIIDTSDDDDVTNDDSGLDGAVHPPLF
jgi:hypothetical protein